VIQLEANWRVRPAFWVVFVTAITIPGLVALSSANDRKAEEYDRVSERYEAFDYMCPPGLPLDLWSKDEKHPDGLHTFAAYGGTLSGPFALGRASGTWDACDSGGRLRGHVTMNDGQPTGPCEFWDPDGSWRISGSYEHWHRVGLWTFDNVLEEGRKHVLYRPWWSVE
jgi:hypothetical protein